MGVRDLGVYCDVFLVAFHPNKHGSGTREVIRIQEQAIRFDNEGGLFFFNESTTANKAFTNSVDLFKIKAQTANKTYLKHLGRGHYSGEKNISILNTSQSQLILFQQFQLIPIFFQQPMWVSLSFKIASIFSASNIQINPPNLEI